MATIMSFDTVCHLEAIERDLIDVLIETRTIQLLREGLEERKFEQLVREVEGEEFLHQLAEELTDILEQEQLKFEETGGC
jgi:hypothetical protein